MFPKSTEYFDSGTDAYPDTLKPLAGDAKVWYQPESKLTQLRNVHIAITGPWVEPKAATNTNRLEQKHDAIYSDLSPAQYPTLAGSRGQFVMA